MAKKDFSSMNTGRLFEAIAEATADPAAQEAAEDQQAQQEPETLQEPAYTYTGPGRKTYTVESAEALELMNSFKTNGRKGLHLKRINLAFSPENYDYITTMARVRGENLTQFVNKIISEHKADHHEIYDKAVEFRNSL